ncbi:hypothetical protein B0T14DRAFT_531802 [Immersiella caudata]|uniref:Metalloendopeptidase n=1 Tax=Immersiella caudata TaxID=314043 RepID=A0AA39U6U8_9PEZI|nr:hypothetical protein B0T14DRAFT_531802 [Immersiella caudata]
MRLLLPQSPVLFVSFSQSHDTVFTCFPQSQTRTGIPSEHHDTMAPLTLVLSLLFAFLLHGQQVLAGSAIWQPALAPRNRHSLNRRYFYARKGTGFGVTQPWPNRLIRYCFNTNTETQAAKAMLKKNLKDARKIWIAKGLNSNFRIEEAHGDTCVNDRDDVLMISYTGNGPNAGMASSVGFTGRGPAMHLTDREMGMLDVVANFAHELGHAWGLFHEHQNPNFWANVVGAEGGEVFGPGNPGGWNCDNLIDYARTAAGGGLVVQTGQNNLGNTRGTTIEEMCSNFRLAAGAQFSASDYLPMTGVGTPHSNGKGASDVDWASIMIYASGAGGVPMGADEEPGEPDRRARILQQPNGERIPKNLFPSALDILALNTMYADVGGTKLSLLNTVSSFKKVYKASDSGPSGGSGCL